MYTSRKIDVPQIKPVNIFLFTSLALPFLMSVSLFASGKGVRQVSNADGSSKGFGIMGDSTSDEYQGDDHRGGDYANTTLNWMEQLVRKRGLNFGSWGTWGEPRRTGYEYNWARSAATAESLISSGQHTGLAKQVAEGKVSHVFLWIGTNDFHFTNGTYKEIYDGSMNDDALQQKVTHIVTNITLAVDTVLAAGPVDMVVVNIGDIGQVPLIKTIFPDAAGRQRVTDAINSINQQLDTMSAQRHIKVVNADDFTRSLFNKINAIGDLTVGGESINVMGVGNEPHNWRLEDTAGHPGTVISGLMANLLFVEPFNSAYQTDIPPLTETEILESAGITHNPLTTFNRFLLIGAGIILLLLIAIGLFKFRRRRHGQ
jgi:phospholipase/lecithinase/hemolysin